MEGDRLWNGKIEAGPLKWVVSNGFLCEMRQATGSEKPLWP